MCSKTQTWNYETSKNLAIWYLYARERALLIIEVKIVDSVIFRHGCQYAMNFMKQLLISIGEEGRGTTTQSAAGNVKHRKNTNRNRHTHTHTQSIPHTKHKVASESAKHRNAINESVLPISARCKTNVPRCVVRCSSFTGGDSAVLQAWASHPVSMDHCATPCETVNTIVDVWVCVCVCACAHTCANVGAFFFFWSCNALWKKMIGGDCCEGDAVICVNHMHTGTGAHSHTLQKIQHVLV